MEVVLSLECGEKQHTEGFNFFVFAAVYIVVFLKQAVLVHNRNYIKALFGTIINIGVIMQNKLNQNKTNEHPETKLIFGIAGVPPSSKVSWAWMFWL